MHFSVIKTACLDNYLVYFKQFFEEKYIVFYLILLHLSEKIIKKSMCCELPINCTNFNFHLLLYDTNFVSEKIVS
ncbi:hypothetical protein, partial [Fischerella thermalis]|uniref:hypothetical protein n=1 Tax=Fischerella thermalis TaxID=372787 RepID=UPI001CA5CF42